MKHNQIIYNNSRLSYYTYGNGKPLLLMHGFAEDHSIWKHQIDHLSKKYFVIAPDLFGVGNSEYLDNENMKLSMRNIPFVEFKLLQNISGYDLILANDIVITESAVEELNNWLLKGEGEVK